MTLQKCEEFPPELEESPKLKPTKQEESYDFLNTEFNGFKSKPSGFAPAFRMK